MRTTAIIQARMGSTRLPGKIMLDLCGKPVLQRVVERLRRSKWIDDIIIATTDLPDDDIVYSTVLTWKTKCFRGSSNDVLSRFYKAAIEYPCDTIVRITSDCPLIDPGVCDDIIEHYLLNNYRYVSNAGADAKYRTYPRGLDCEVFSFELLEEANKKAKENYEREHVTPYMYWKNKSVFYYMNNDDFSNLRWTLDTAEDYDLISRIYAELGNKNEIFNWKDVLKAYEHHSEWKSINDEVEQRMVAK